MSRYDWLLFVHVLAAFAIAAGLTLLTGAMILTLRRTGDEALALSLTRFSPFLFDGAGVLVLVLGIWLAIDIDGYELWDPWILAALVLWVVIAFSGARALAAFRRARKTAGPGTDLATAVRDGRAPLWNAVAIAAVLATLILMIFKPGA
ncbi:MAG: DUF2269 family protein [Actinobacteria bacterium]|nr:DUF2269 family protein [Actinomycetota bacterium]